MFYVVFYFAKLGQLLLKILNRKASYFPGKFAIKLYPSFLKKIDKPKIIIGVTGTNGKTTVCNLLINYFEKNGDKVLNNRFGTNVNSGIASALISGTNLHNKSKYTYAVLEIDERSFPKVLPYVKLDYLICTNLFRDSIRRNANSEFIFDIINSNIDKDTTLILNADDIVSSALGKENKKVYFGVDKFKNDSKESTNIINDTRVCPNCLEKLDYLYIKYHHIGKAICPNCGFKSKDADYKVTKVNYDKNILYTEFYNNKQTFKLISDSIFNMYNQIAVIALLNELKMDNRKIEEFFEECEIVETRYSKTTISGINVISHLAKGQNSVACSTVFDYVSKKDNDKEIILVLYDYFDAINSSENITWIYDTDFEFLNNPLIKKIIIYGPRAEDFNLRLLFAGIKKNKIVVTKKVDDIVENLSLKKGIDIYLLFELYDQKIATEINKKIVDKIRRTNSD